MLFSIWLLFLINNGFAISALYRQQVSIVRTHSVYPTPVDILISFKSNDRLKEQRLYGKFSSSGTGYETVGDVVQAPTFRACDTSKVDHTMSNHIVVMFYDDDHTYLAGCVSLDNQVNFAQNSNALALVVGPEDRVASQLNKSRRGRIPVIMLNDNQTNLLKLNLVEATRQSSVARFHIRYFSSNTTKSPVTLRLQVLRPTVVNIGLFVFLILLILFIGGLVFIKIKWRSELRHDIHLRTLAKSALEKMEIRRFVKASSNHRAYSKYNKGNKLFCFARKNRKFSMLGSLYSIPPSCGSQERCSICLEEYKDGQELRVLFCGHEFHPKCVDPWLLNNRRCPLCQYDVVYKEYPGAGKNHSPKVNRAANLSTENCINQQEVPLLPLRNNISEASSSFLSANISYMQIPYDTNTHSKWKQQSRQRIVQNEFSSSRFPVLLSRTMHSRISCFDNINRRRRDVLSRRLRRRSNYQLKPRSMRAQQRRRYHKPRMVLPLPAQLIARESPVEQLEAVSGYSSDVSSYPDPDGPPEIDDLSFLFYSFSFPQTSSSGRGVLSTQLDLFSNTQRSNKFFSSSRPQDKISLSKPYQISCRS